MPDHFNLSDGAIKLIESNNEAKVITLSMSQTLSMNGHPALEATSLTWDYILTAVFRAGHATDGDAFQSLYESLIAVFGIYRTCEKCNHRTTKFHCDQCEQVE